MSVIIPHECIEETNQKRRVLPGNRTKMVFENSRRVPYQIITVDNCAIKEGARCDYLVLPKPDEECFVELKGHRVSHALKQIERTIILLSSSPKSAKKYCYIISTRCPISSPEIQKIKKQFSKKYNSKLTIKNFYCTHAI